MFDNFYNGKKVFVAGHTDFKGGWVTLLLKSLGAQVLGYALEPDTYPSMYEEVKLYSHCRNEFGNILDVKRLEETMKHYKPDIVFNLAAQPFAYIAENDPVTTYKTNILGALNVLETAKKCPSVKAFVNATKDRGFENNLFDKTSQKLDVNYNMYASAMDCSEILTNAYNHTYLKNQGFALASAQNENIIGGGDWASRRLIPDCIKLLNENKDILVNNAVVLRPFQFVLEPLVGYLLLAKKLYENGSEYSGTYNFAPNRNSLVNVVDIIQKTVELYGKGKVIAEMNVDADTDYEILDNSLSVSKLGWKPVYDAQTALVKTVDWYKNFYNDEDMYEVTMTQIQEFINAAE